MYDISTQKKKQTNTFQKPEMKQKCPSLGFAWRFRRSSKHILPNGGLRMNPMVESIKNIT